jgi:uncharacterized protein with PQ loop repeat
MSPFLDAALSALLLLTLTVSSVVLCVPQLVRLIRVGHAAGLSGASLLFGTVNYTVWSGYLAWEEAWGLLLANVVASLVWYAVVALALPKIAPARSWWLPVGWAGVLGLLGLVDPHLLGPVLGLGSLLTYTPQAVGVWRVLSLAAVSPMTWWLTAVEGFSWLLQSVKDQLAGGILSGGIATAAAVSVLTALLVRGAALATEDGAPVGPEPEPEPEPDLVDGAALPLAA